jgi:hypothetical protein
LVDGIDVGQGEVAPVDPGLVREQEEFRAGVEEPRKSMRVPSRSRNRA